MITASFSRISFLSTPSARRATSTFKAAQSALVISIHALREEGDRLCIIRHTIYDLFLSTPSARRATQQHQRCTDAGSISIHALREEGDRMAVTLGRREVRISIHALREEGDRSCPATIARGCNFYPRPPRGGRLFHGSPLFGRGGFLSTPSARRATVAAQDAYKKDG